MSLIKESFPIGTLGCNCTIISSPKTHEAIIIDPGNDAPTLLKKISTQGHKVKKLLHTHAHFDHIGASQEIKEKTHATLHLHDGDQLLYDHLKEQGYLFGQKVGTPGKIDHYIQDEETYGLDDPQLKDFLKAIHTPGHTPGSCCFYTEYFGVPLLLSGDTLFQGSIGRTDLPGGDFDQIIESIRGRLLTLPDETTVIPGHGPVTFLHQEKKHNPFLK